VSFLTTPLNTPPTSQPCPDGTAILEDLADLEDLYLAEKRLAKVRNGKSKTYTLNAVEQALGLANLD